MVSKSKKGDSSIVPKGIYKPSFPTAKTTRPTNTFPLAQYTSLVGTQALLLLFSALYLPRSTTYLFGPGALEDRRIAKTSLDRPEHPFMVELTDWPAVTMAWVCAGTALVVAWWGGHVRGWGKQAREDDGTKQQSTTATKPTTAPVPSSEKSRAVRGASLATACGVPCFYFLLVLFGAPINSHYACTALLATLLSLLTISTPVYTLGLPSLTSSDSKDVYGRLTYVRLFSEFAPRTALEQAIVYPVLGCLFGCAIGAFPIPLDWDRPWQAWPLTPAFGAIVGYILGSLYAVVSASSTQDTPPKTE